MRRPGWSDQILKVAVMTFLMALLALALGHNRVFGRLKRSSRMRGKTPAPAGKGTAIKQPGRMSPPLGLGGVSIGDKEKTFLMTAANKAFRELKATGRLPDVSALGPVPPVCARKSNWVLFLTLYAPAKRPLRVTVLGERALYESLLEAVKQVWTHPAYKARRFDRDYRVRIKLDIVKDIAPVPYDRRDVFSRESVTEVAGLMLETDRAFGWLLPADLKRHNIATKGEMLNVAARLSGLPELAWRNPNCNVLRLKTISFINKTPGADDYLDIVRTHPAVGEITPQKLMQACFYGAKYLSRNQQANGRFLYQYLAAMDRKVEAPYSIVRHCGVTWSLFQLYGVTGIDEFKKAGEKAVGHFFKNLYIDIRRPEMAYIAKSVGQPRKVYLGGSALGAVALLERKRRLAGDERHDTLIRSLLDFIVFMQTPVGRFNCIYDVDLDKRYNSPELGASILYYPGEATLALVMGGKVLGEPKYLVAARKSIDYLTKSRDLTLDPETDTIPPHDHWLCLSIHEISSVAPVESDAEYAYRVVLSMEKAHYTEGNSPAPDFTGGKRSDGPPSACGTATDIEAYASTWFVLDYWSRRKPEWKQKRDNCFKWAVRSAKFLLAHQLLPENSYYIPNPDRAMGGITGNPTTTMIRSDYIQHSISACIRLTEILRLSSKDKEGN